MANVLEECPNACAVVNFSASLIEQINEYSREFDDYLRQQKPFNDAILFALSQDTIPAASGLRQQIVKQCVRANEKNLIQRYPHYQSLVKLAQGADKDSAVLTYYTEQYFFDLLVWYHLAWLGETIKQRNQEAQYLINKGRNFDSADRQLLIKLLHQIIRNIIPQYKTLQQRGQIELSLTPDNHPILPLLISLDKAKEAMPDAPLPQGLYDGGLQRAENHITQGLDIFQQNFATTPSGCWPSEGGLCIDTLKLLSNNNFKWTASGGNVLKNSLKINHHEGDCIHHGFRFGGQETACFFRDDHLSDLIGFSFQDWEPQRAIEHLVEGLLNIRTACHQAPDAVVPIILDGENCWEYYQQNGYLFLKALYQTLSEHPLIKLSTFSQYLEESHQIRTLDRLVAGSWVYGDFSTWIGSADKNRAWDLLIKAKHDYDRSIGSLPPQQQKEAERQLAVCEASDWFWWFGDYNAQESVHDFDHLFRLHLTNLYKILKLDPPEQLQKVISQGGGTPEMDGTMRRSNQEG